MLLCKNRTHNNGELTNEEVFYNHFKSFHKDNTDTLLKKYEEYYNSDFIITKESTSLKKVAPLLIKELKEKGYNLILATNPIFPRIATLNRIKWAGLDPNDFMYISTYENSSYCKPNIKYYEEIINKLNEYEKRIKKKLIHPSCYHYHFQFCNCRAW